MLISGAPGSGKSHLLREAIVPGLVASGAQVLVIDYADLIGAKIMTVGERAEDVFHLRGADGLPLAEDAAERLVARLTDALDRRQSA